MSKKTININLSKDVINQMDEKRKPKDFSRSKLIEYLIKKWIRDGCKIIMED